MDTTKLGPADQFLTRWIGCQPDLAATLTRSMMSCWRLDSFPDPEAYSIATVQLLTQYPIEVVRRVTSPILGLPRQKTWPPSIAEIDEACQRELRNLPEPPKGVGEWRHCYHGQEANLLAALSEKGTSLEEFNQRWDVLETKRRFEEDREPVEHRKAVVNSAREQMRDSGFKFETDRGRHAETPAAVQKKFNISAEQFNKLPPTNAKPDAWGKL